MATSSSEACVYRCYSVNTGSGCHMMGLIYQLLTFRCSLNSGAALVIHPRLRYDLCHGKNHIEHQLSNLP